MVSLRVILRVPTVAYAKAGLSLFAKLSWVLCWPNSTTTKRDPWRQCRRNVDLEAAKVKSSRPVFAGSGDVVNGPDSGKLHYDDIGPRCSEMDAVWAELLSTDNRSQYRMDESVLSAAVRRG